MLLHVRNNGSKTKKHIGNLVGMLISALKFDSHCYVEKVLQPTITKGGRDVAHYVNGV